ASSSGSKSSRRETSVARAAARSCSRSKGSRTVAARQNDRMRPVPTFSPLRRRKRPKPTSRWRTASSGPARSSVRTARAAWAPALQRVVKLAGPVRRDDHGRRPDRPDPADLGDGYGELREHLQKERLELVVGAVQLVHEEDRAVPRSERGEQGAFDQELLAEQ